MNATLVGFVAVLIWGFALPLTRLIEEQFGIFAAMGVSYAGSGLLAFLRHRMTGQSALADKQIFRNPLLYVRWACFLIHETFGMIAILIVRQENVPFVILLNYLWPTAIIVCSVLLDVVKITRWWAFLVGSLVVIISLSIEMLVGRGVTAGLFDNATDWLAYILIFVGAIAWGFYCAVSRRAGDTTGGGVIVPFFQLTLGLALPLSFVPGLATWGNLTGWWLALLLGNCFLQFIAYLSWDIGTRRGNIVILSLGADFIPWLSLLTFSCLFKTPIETRTILAAILLVCGAMITRYGTLPKRASSVPKALRALEKEGA